MAQADQVRIYNMVRLLLEEGKEIQSVDEEKNTLARQLNIIYHDVRDQLFEIYPWNFCMTPKLISAHAQKPEFGWENQFTLPSDFIKLPYLTENGEFEGEPIPFKLGSLVVGEDRVRVILANCKGPLKVNYTARVEDERQYSPLFVQLLASRLALWVAHNKTGKQSYVERIKAIYDEAMNAAIASDSVQGAQPRAITSHGTETPDWIDIRHS